MKKTLIILTIAFVIAAPSVVGAQGPQTGDFSAQVKTFFNKVFQGKKYEYERRIETPNVTPSEQERSVPSLEVEAEPGAPTQLREANPPSREITLPYCESADIDLHYKLASEYIRSGFSEYSVVKERHHLVGPCNRGNTAWTAFAVVNNEGDLVGQVVVNGDTEEVSFNKVEWDNIAPIPTPDRPATSVSPKAEPPVPPVQRLGEPVKEKTSERRGIFERIRKVTEQGREAPAEQETGERKTNIFNRIKNVLRTKEGPVGPGEFRPAEEARVSEEVRAKLEQKRVEVREKIREHREEVRTIQKQVAERVQEKKQAFEQRIQAIQNQKKQALANRIYDKVYDIREKIIEHFNRTLDKLDTVVTNISTRADKAESEGFNVENVRSAVSNAESKIAEARESVKTALGKEYSPEGTDLETLRGEFHSIRNELKNNLESVRNMVRNAHEATRSAAEELTQVLESE